VVEGYLETGRGLGSGCSVIDNAERGGSVKPGRADKRLTKKAEQLAKEQARKKASFDREQVIEETERVDKPKRSEKRLAQEHEQLAREQERKKAFLTKEQAIVEAQEARKIKDKKQSPE
jgi:hypothetical protein